MTKQNENLKISIVIPTYNMSATIGETIKSILNQTYKNYEIIVQDNDSQDNTLEIIKSFSDSRIKYFKNGRNVGYAKNLIEGKNNCTGDILYFLGADDVLSQNALMETQEAFSRNDNIGAVTRPYFWFQDSIDIPIRVTPCVNGNSNEIINIKNFSKATLALHNEILGQLSGLAFRIKYLEDNFFTTENDWIAHGYPFVNIFKKHPVVFLKKYQIAVRIGVNIVRQKGNPAYDVSPTKRWVAMLDEILYEKEFQEFKRYFIKKIIATNYVGLIQIKNYSKIKFVFREIAYLLRYRWINIFDLKFWFFSLGCILIPSSILTKMVDYYKNKINNKVLERLDFRYNIN